MQTSRYSLCFSVASLFALCVASTISVVTFLTLHRDDTRAAEANIIRKGGTVIRGCNFHLLFEGKASDEYPTGDVVIFCDTTITDDLIESIRSLPCLSAVVLKSTNITAPQLSTLLAAHEIEWIDLEGALVGDDVAMVICRNRGVRRINLNGTLVTDRALECISMLSELEVLELSNTRVSPAGIKQLSTLKTLKELHLNGVELSEKEATEIEMAFPSTALVW